MIFSTSIEIHPHDTDFSRRISPVTLGSYILDTAGRAANEHGFGMSHMNTSGAAWVLSRFSVEMHSLPLQYETITIHTWVRAVNPIFSKRLYIVTDKNNNIVAEADSLWSVIDLNTRKVVNLTELGNLTDYIVEKDNSITPTTKIGKQSLENSQQFNHHIIYSDIDLNVHVNSMKYLQWALDTHNIDYFKENSIHRYDMNFLKEMTFGQEANIHREEIEKSSLFSITNDENTPCCRIKLHLK